MKLINHPPLVAVPFALGGTRNTIPVNPSGTAGAASYSSGFPAVTMQPIASGGTPPWGQDFNGLLYAITNSTRWAMSGGTFNYDSTFAADANVGGYPKGALLQSTNGRSYWMSLVDDNTTDPDSGANVVTNWAALTTNSGSLTVVLSSGSVTPTPASLCVQQILAVGTLTANQTVTLPLVAGMAFVFANQTTGSFTVTAIGATGTGVVIPQGQAMTIACDGSNWYATSSSNTGAYLPIGGTAVAATKLATARQFTITGDATTTTPGSFDGTANVALNVTIANGAVTLAKMANLTASSLLGNPTGSAAAPQAVTLTNGIIFNGTALGLGAIAPTGAATFASADNTFSSTAPLRFTGMGTNGTIFIHGTNGSGDDILNIGRSAANNYSVNVNGNVTATAQVQGQTILSQSSSTSAMYVSNGGNLRIAANNGNSKYFRVNPSNAGLEIVNNAYSAVVAWIGDDGSINSIAAGNFQLSDENAKCSIDRFAEPRPLHHEVPWTTYLWKDSGAPGRGAIAQDVMAVAPEYVRRESPNGTEQLVLDKLGLASEMSFWAARGVDALLRRVAELEEMVYGGGKQ